MNRTSKIYNLEYRSPNRVLVLFFSILKGTLSKATMVSNLKILLFLVMVTFAMTSFSQTERDTLLVGVYLEPPYVMKDSEQQLEGLSIDLWEEIASEIDVPFTYVEFSDEISIVRALDYDELDIAINPMTNSPVRVDKFEVTQPFYSSSIGVAITTKSQSQFSIFLSYFFSKDFLNVIMLLFIILLIFGALSWFVERRVNKYQFRPGIKGLFDGIWWAAVTMTTVGYGDKAPKTNAGKTIAVIWMFTAVFVIANFTATVASTLTVNTLEARISGLEDLKAIEDVGVVGASEGEDFLREENMTPSETYRRPIQALRALARKDIHILLHDKTSMEYLIQTNRLQDRVQLLPLAFNKQYCSFLMPKSHPDFDAVNRSIVKYIGEPSWQDILKKYNLDDDF